MRVFVSFVFALQDRLLAELLTNQKNLIVTYHEHDSLLENKVDQVLSEEERKAAWEEYENEKKGLIQRTGEKRCFSSARFGKAGARLCND